MSLLWILFGRFITTTIDSFQEALNESLNLFFLKRSTIISIDGIEDTFVNLWKLLLVNQYIGQVLNSLLEIHFFSILI